MARLQPFRYAPVMGACSFATMAETVGAVSALCRCTFGRSSAVFGTLDGFTAAVYIVLVQPEMERGGFPLVSIPPFGRGFSRHLIRPPGYPSAWLRPRSRFRFTRQDHCSSTPPIGLNFRIARHSTARRWLAPISQRSRRPRGTRGTAIVPPPRRSRFSFMLGRLMVDPLRP